MVDTHLSDDMIKLVEYSIVCTARDQEGVVYGPVQVTETRNRTGSSFTSAKIARFFDDELPVINRARAARGEPQLDYDADDLEVHYQVLGRWPKQSRRSRKGKLDRLAEIGEAILELRRVAAANEAARTEPASDWRLSASPPVVEAAAAKPAPKKPARRKPRKAGAAKAKKKKKKTVKKKTTRKTTANPKPAAAGTGRKKKASKPRLRVPGAPAEAPKE